MPMLMRLKVLAKVRMASMSTARRERQPSRSRQPVRASHAKPSGPPASSGSGVLTASVTR